MIFPFDQMKSITFNGKTVVSATWNGHPVFPNADFKTVKLNLGSSFHILGIYDNVVAGYTVSNNVYTCKTYNLNTGAQLTSFNWGDVSTSSGQNAKIRAFYRDNAGTYGYKGFIFMTAYFDPLFNTWPWTAWKESGTDIYGGVFTGPSTGKIDLCYSGTLYDNVYAAFINGSNKYLYFDGINLNSSNYFSSSYEFYPSVPASVVTKISDIHAEGDFVECVFPNLNYNPVYYSTAGFSIRDRSPYTGYGAGGGNTYSFYDPCWTLNYGYFIGIFNNGSSLYIGGTGTAYDSAYKPISQGAIPNSGYTGFTTVYLYKSSDHSIYKLESGTYTKLGETIATSGVSMLDNTKKYRADLATGIIYHFPV